MTHSSPLNALDFLHSCRVALYAIHRATGCTGPLLAALDLSKLAETLILKRSI